MIKASYFPAMIRGGWLLACLFCAAAPVQAGSVRFGFCVSYFPPTSASPAPPFEGSVLVGSASFYELRTLDP
jgi:hypothetical protein